MKKILLTLGLVMGIAAGVYAEHPTAEHPKAEHPSTPEKAVSPADKVAGNLQNSGAITAEEVSLVNPAIVLLLENGATTDEAENIVTQAVTEAKNEGLEGGELAAKVTEAAQGYTPAEKAEHPGTGSEHPKAEHPGR